MRHFEIVIRTVWDEARGEGPDGMAAVTHVIMHRRSRDRWPDTLGGVCTQPLQFSGWNSKAPHRLRMLTVDESDPHYMEAIHVVSGCLLGQIPDPTNGADHYFNPDAVVRQPEWADETKLTVVIGRHRFYRLAP